MALGRQSGLKKGGGTLGRADNQLTGAFPAWLLANTTAGNGTLELQARPLPAHPLPAHPLPAAQTQVS